MAIVLFEKEIFRQYLKLLLHLKILILLERYFEINQKAVFLKLEKTFKGSKIGTKLTNTAKGINKYLPIFEKFILS